VWSPGSVRYRNDIYKAKTFNLPDMLRWLRITGARTYDSRETGKVALHLRPSPGWERERRRWESFH